MAQSTQVWFSDVLAVLQELPALCATTRRLHRISQRELGERAGLGVATIWRLENGAGIDSVSLRSAIAVLQALRDVSGEGGLYEFYVSGPPGPIATTKQLPGDDLLDVDLVDAESFGGKESEPR